MSQRFKYSYHSRDLLKLCLCISQVLFANAFLGPSTRRFVKPQTGCVSRDNLVMLKDTSNPLDDVTELTSTLARLDTQWKLTQRSKDTKSRWTRLVLPKDEKDDLFEERPGEMKANLDPEDFVWLLEPPNSIPSCVIVFTGGAGLGQFPHIAYSQLLTRLSDRLNAAIVAAPYSVGLDHFGLAKQTGERIRRALLYCEEDPARSYSPNIPTYSLAHSLGCKLQTIYMAATGQDFEGVGFLSFNNFSFGQTVQMARTFADELGKSRQSPSGFGNPSKTGSAEQIMNQVFEFAEMAVGAVGIDFTPNSKDTEKLIELKYDDELQEKTRLFVFDDDKLDSSKEFVESCSGSPALTVSGLPGGHLTPVFFKLDLDEFGKDDPTVPPEARAMAKEAIGFQTASFGDEAQLDELVNELYDWILGKGPKRAPMWSKARDGPPLIEGSVAESR